MIDVEAAIAAALASATKMHDRGKEWLSAKGVHELKNLARRLQAERDAYRARAQYWIECFYDDPSITYKEQVDKEAAELMKQREGEKGE